MREYMKRESGITLIALGITIVVMLILAGITIGKGIEGMKEARENKLISELGMVNHAILETKTNMDVLKETYPGVPYTNISDVTIVIEEINGQKEEGDTIELKDPDNPENYYFLSVDDLKKIGIKDAEDEYIVNYKTGEVINTTKKVTPQGKPLYTYSIDHR